MAYTVHPVWPFPPNWESGILERLEWFNDLLTSETDVEQRIARRLTPRRTLEASFLITAEKRQQFDAFMSGYGSSVFAIPLWYEMTRLQSSAASGTDLLTLDTRWREYEAGDYMMVRAPNSLKWEAIQILAKTDTSLQLISNLENSWPAGTFCYPMKIARFLGPVQTRKKTGNTIQFSAVFTLAEIAPNSSIWMSVLDYRGTSIIEHAPDDSEDLTSQYNRRLQIFDEELGLREVLDPALKGNDSVQYRWTIVGAQKREELRRILYYLAGRRKAIWVPTFMDDLVLAAPITAFDTTIQIKNVGFSDHLQIEPSKRDIRIALRDGYLIMRRIVSSIVSSSDVETLALDAPIFFDVPLSDVGNISFMACRRMDQDSVEINHIHDADGAASCVITWRGHTDPGTIWLTSKPFPLSPLDSLDVSGELGLLAYLIPMPLDELDFVSGLELTGTLRQPLFTYTFGLFEGLDAVGSALESTGTLRQTLVGYTFGLFEGLDAVSGGLEPTGILKISLIVYTYWPFDGLDVVSGGLEPTGTLV